jgi:hypothetical protein
MSYENSILSEWQKYDSKYKEYINEFNTLVDKIKNKINSSKISLIEFSSIEGCDCHYTFLGKSFKLCMKFHKDENRDGILSHVDIECFDTKSEAIKPYKFIKFDYVKNISLYIAEKEAFSALHSVSLNERDDIVKIVYELLEISLKAYNAHYSPTDSNKNQG